VGSLVDMSFGEYVQNVARIFGCAAVMSLSVYLLGSLMPKQLHPVPCLIIQVAVGISLYGGLIVGFKVKAYHELWDVLSNRFGGISAVPSTK